MATIAISPDGSRLVYKVFPEGDPTSPNAVLYQHELGQLSGRLIPGTEGAQGFFFSPDGTWIGVNRPSARSTAVFEAPAGHLTTPLFLRQT